MNQVNERFGANDFSYLPFAPLASDPNAMLAEAKAYARGKRNYSAAQMFARWTLLTAGGLTVAAALPGAAMQMAVGTFAAGALQRRLSSGVMHEASHGTLSTDKTWNRRMGELAGALALIDFEEFRSKHMAHHKDLASSRDPERQDLEKLGLRVDGTMSDADLLRMGIGVFSPNVLLSNMKASLRFLARRRGALAMWTVLLAATAIAGGAAWPLLIGWFLASFSIRPLLWLYANAGEHDFELGAAIEALPGRDERLADAVSEEAMRLSTEPKPIQWLAVSRERRGIATFVLNPESERLYHLDHHANSDIPGEALSWYSRLRAQLDPVYAKHRKSVRGLFMNPRGGEAALTRLKHRS